MIFNTRNILGTLAGIDRGDIATRDSAA